MSLNLSLTSSSLPGSEVSSLATLTPAALTGSLQRESGERREGGGGRG